MVLILAYSISTTPSLNTKRQKMNIGLGTKPNNLNNFNSFLKKTFGPLFYRNASRQQKLEESSKPALNTVLRPAKLVKYATDFQANGRPFHYRSLVEHMYLKVGRYLKNIIAEIL